RWQLSIIFQRQFSSILRTQRRLRHLISDRPCVDNEDQEYFGSPKYSFYFPLLHQKPVFFFGITFRHYACELIMKYLTSPLA
ncbi:MAG: hypothetical protein U9R58_11795, partial [Chloroflexota bacterium]|nr:hypothetical protein [Chloroflexota bacterium]